MILDCVGASYWEQNMEAIATDGRWVLYGLLGGSNISGNILAGLLMKRVRLEGSALRSRSNEVSGHSHFKTSSIISSCVST